MGFLEIDQVSGGDGFRHGQGMNEISVVLLSSFFFSHTRQFDSKALGRSVSPKVSFCQIVRAETEGSTSIESHVPVRRMKEDSGQNTAVYAISDDLIPERSPAGVGSPHLVVESVITSRGQTTTNNIRNDEVTIDFHSSKSIVSHVLRNLSNSKGVESLEERASSDTNNSTSKSTLGEISDGIHDIMMMISEHVSII